VNKRQANQHFERTKMVLKMLLYLLFNHLMQLPVWESLTEYSSRESSRL